MLKGRQTGSMHRGHTWVFRAESYDTMLAWYDDIKSLTETTTEERHAFVRRHARSVSTGSAVAGSSKLRCKSDQIQVGGSLRIFRSHIPRWEVDNVLIHLPVGTPTMTTRARNMIYR